MHINIFNGCLLFAWLLITVGGMILNVGGGLLLSGIALVALVAGLEKKFGVYAPNSDKSREED